MLIVSGYLVFSQLFISYIMCIIALVLTPFYHS